MARFRATIQGSRGEASRLGGAKTGINAKVNGWDAGIQVVACEINGRDCFEVFHTGGSNGAMTRVYIGAVMAGKWVPA